MKYTNNEAYFDVVEEVDAIIDKAGSTVFAEIQGYVRFSTCFLLLATRLISCGFSYCVPIMNTNFHHRGYCMYGFSNLHQNYSTNQTIF